jgi:serine/threonine protein kinase
MGTVWLAHPYDDPDTFYAVKTVSPQFARDPSVCGMFVKEASLAAAIEHPNVVHLYDVGIHDDVPFFVMEWVDGCSLRDVARRVVETGERVPPSIALRIAADLCAGLHAAHELTDDYGQPLGLVHRDVSPHNVLVTREGVSKLIDFGVAKARDLATNNTEDSMVGGIKGKVRYMAPEQAMEKDIDRRADIFSVGAVTYQLLTGRAPFEGPNEVAIINALLSTQPVYVPDDLPEPVQWILRRALARRPENRFSDAAEMQNAIELALVEMGAPDKPWDVAECLAWFVPPTEPLEAITASRRHHGVPEAPESDISTQLRDRKHTGSLPPPQLAFSAPTNSIPARRPSLIDPDEIAMQQRTKRGGGGSMRFVLMAAAGVGVLGIGAAMLVKDPTPSEHGSDRPSTTEVDTAPITPATTSAPTQPAVNPNTPIIDMGDVTEEQKKDKKKQHRRTKPSSDAPATAPAPAPKIGASKDLAGDVKVWK